MSPAFQRGGALAFWRVRPPRPRVDELLEDWIVVTFPPKLASTKLRLISVPSCIGCVKLDDHRLQNDPVVLAIASTTNWISVAHNMTKMNLALTFLTLLLVATLELSSSFLVVPAKSCRARCQRPSLAMSSDDESSTPETSSTEERVEPPKPAVKCPNCDLCDGSGRITGGIGAVLDWWPIKAYRPCPNFIERGGFYQRSGQGLDEIAFGRDSTFEVDKK